MESEKKVQVITAGGAGNPTPPAAGGSASSSVSSNGKRNRRKRNRRNKKKGADQQPKGKQNQQQQQKDQEKKQQPPTTPASGGNGKETENDLLAFAQPAAAIAAADSSATDAMENGTSGGVQQNEQAQSRDAMMSALELEESESNDVPAGMTPLISPQPRMESEGNIKDIANRSNAENDSIFAKKDDDDDDEGRVLLSSQSVVEDEPLSKSNDVFWLFFCFLGIMASFVCYGLLLEYTTSGGRKLHELSFLFVTSSLYTVTAAFGRYVRAETPTTIPPARFAVLGITSMGSTFCSVRSLRYVIYPIQVLAKSCKPVPVMIFGALMGKRYPLRKYFNVCLIVMGVALFMGGGKEKKATQPTDSETDSSSQMFGIVLLFISLCFDGGTGAYEDKLMSVHSVQPFDLMYNIQLGKTILAGISLVILNQVHIFLQMCQDMGFLLVALGISGAMGQVFIFVTIAKFGALTCSIIGLARKVTTLVASIYFYGHSLNGIQFTGLAVAVGSMIMNFMGKSKKGDGHGGGHGAGSNSSSQPTILPELDEEMKRLVNRPEGSWGGEHFEDGDVELQQQSSQTSK